MKRPNSHSIFGGSDVCAEGDKSGASDPNIAGARRAMAAASDRRLFGTRMEHVGFGESHDAERRFTVCLTATA